MDIEFTNSTKRELLYVQLKPGGIWHRKYRDSISTQCRLFAMQNDIFRWRHEHSQAGEKTLDKCEYCEESAVRSRL